MYTQVYGPRNFHLHSNILVWGSSLFIPLASAWTYGNLYRYQSTYLQGMEAAQDFI